ncbi:hypothetical protein BDZ97DRAFT_1958891 [Flammula alnicola]|nr:hypothetical protein BDZ97DRAFT_1958891 [Flammula alnicola]
MPSADNVTFSSVAERIRTLTTMLQGMGTRASPTSKKTEVPLFLRHLVALFTCNDTFDNEAKAIAVTGSITIEGVRILVVTQNPFNMSPPSELRVEVVAKGDKTFQQVVGEYEVTLKEHISDLCAILANYNSHSGDRVKQFSDFCLFVVDRSFRKLSSRVFQDEQSWKVNLVQRIYYWTPGECELDDIQWINRPMWASSQAMFPDGMRQRTLDGSGGQVQWELSNTTVKAWAQFLARKANDAKEAERSKPAGEKRPEKVASALRDVHAFCHLLYRFINWEANVVQILLTKTSLAYRLGLESPTDGIRDMFNPGAELMVPYLDDMGREPTESRGQQVLQYLQSIVAWHAAIMSLYDRTLSLRVPENLDIGLVEVPRCSVKVMSKDDINAEFFRRYPASSLAARATIGDSLPDLCPFRFTGTVHAETTLMGLLSYFAEGSDRVKYDVQIQNEAVLEEIIGPATFERAIAVSNNCCWCCNWLGNKLTDINLPASHGVIYAWSPPLVGVDIAVLRDLEDILWRKLASALRNASQTRSRRSVHYNTVACRLR